ncbi:MAG: right-handed parallel beta-helix repeat-containing protein [Candidatus Poribacteria bacterium]|nr:right-handed parallel beta-helix repeat-containing protein [Candidatus Poribacteria bacterium]
MRPTPIVICALISLMTTATFPTIAKTITVDSFDSTAIAAAIAQSADGDTVSLPAGTYDITESVRPNSNTQLIGAGREKTVLRFTGEDEASVLNLTGRGRVEIANLTIDGNRNPNAAHGVSASNAHRLYLHHLTIRDFVPTDGFGPLGIYFTGNNPTKANGVTDSEIADCMLTNIGVGADFGGGIRMAWGSSRNRVLRNVITDTGRGGIFGNDGSTDLVIRENRVGGSQGEGLGIEVWGGCDRSIVEDNVIDHWLSVDGSDYTAVRRNVVSDKSGVYKYSGLELVGSNFCVFTDNLVDEGSTVGISVSNQEPKNYIYWGYNTIQGCNQWGAQLQGEEGGIAYHYFYRCKFLNTYKNVGNPRYPNDSGHGFRTNGNVHHVTLEECEFRDNGRLGIQLGGENIDALSFVRCVIENNGGDAVRGPEDYTVLEWLVIKLRGNGGNFLPGAKLFPAPPPVAGIQSATTANVGDTLRFVSASDNIARVLWDFNDGIPSTDADATHTYANAGTYRVTLLVWDEAGRGARAEQVVTVTE